MRGEMKRLLLASFFISLLFLLNTYHYLNHEMYEAYPDNKEVMKGFEGNVSIHGTVSNTSSDGFYIRVTHGSKSKIINVLSEINVESGDRVEVLGLLQRDEIIPEKLIVYKKWSYYSVFIRSILALSIVVYLFFKYWACDLRGMKFRRRKDA